METRKKTSYSLNKELLKRFDEQAKRMAINKSALVELLIEKWLNENERKKEMDEEMPQS